jgi:putrescine transport system permease protein
MAGIAAPTGATTGPEAELPKGRGIKVWLDRKAWRDFIVAIPYVWLLFFFLLPFFIVFAMSFARSLIAVPPFEYNSQWPYIVFDNYHRLFTDGRYLQAYSVSIINAGLATILCLIIGYPMALGIARTRGAWRNILLLLVILPFWTSFLLRVYAWIGLLSSNSWFNRGLTSLYNTFFGAFGTINNVPMMNTNFAVVLIIVYSYLPFMILPLYANLERLDYTLNEAAMDLGSKPWQVFKDVTLPLSIPGIVAGALLVFIPASGELVIPSLVGRADNPMIGRMINDEFGLNRDWPMASTVAVALLVLLVVPIMIYNHMVGRAEKGSA